MYSDTPGVCGGDTHAQFLCGLEPLTCDTFGMNNNKQFVNTPKDVIYIQGDMDMLVSDSAQVEFTGRVKDTICAYIIGKWSSEPHQHHHNPAERKYQHVKSTTNRMMGRSGSPAST